MRRFLFSLLLAATALATFAEPVKILAIGNSFSRDAIEQYLHELCVADSIDAIIGNMYIGGCTLERHMNNARGDVHEYQYRKIAADGTMTETNRCSLAEALADEEWDYISLQQASGDSGLYYLYDAGLPRLVKYVQEKAPGAKLIWHQTWAYAKDAQHPEYPKYCSDQQQMYLDIVACSHRVMLDYPFEMVVPCGTAIQNARAVAGDVLNRDGYHLDYGFGRFTAACTWFEQLFGKDVRLNPYCPEKVTPEQEHIAKNAAHAAVASPWQVSLD